MEVLVCYQCLTIAMNTNEVFQNSHQAMYIWYVLMNYVPIHDVCVSLCMLVVTFIFSSRLEKKDNI